MEPALLLVLVLRMPIHLDTRVAIWSSPFVPVVLPVDWLPVQEGAAWYLDQQRQPLAPRIARALNAGLEEAAWRHIAEALGGKPLTTDLGQILQTWANRQMTVQGWREEAAGLVVLTKEPRVRERVVWSAHEALREVLLLLHGLAPPRWRGPLVIVPVPTGGPPPADAPEAQVRPALPIIHLPLAGDEQDYRQLLGGILAETLLQLDSPPSSGWPPWLVTGVKAVAGKRALGQWPSPRVSQERRQGAGVAGLATLWTATAPETNLAEAVMALLLHTRRQQCFPAFLDGIRHGLDVPQALEIAYGLAVEDLPTVR